MCTCRICGENDVDEKYVVQEMMYGTKEEFEYFVCKRCGCLQIKNIPGDLSKYYASSYYSFKQPDIGENTLGEVTELQVLDVGCGGGSFLCELAKKGVTVVHGCDPFIENDIEYVNGVKIFRKSIHEMNGKYDCIFMNDSFEHVTDPHEVLESAKRLLKKNGIVRIDIPVFPNIAFDMFGPSWYQIDAPRHIVLHSETSMEYIAHAHGFKVIEKRWNSKIGQITNSFLYTQGIPLVLQTERLAEQYFSQEDAIYIHNQVQIANANKYGDHALFVLALETSL